MLERQQVNLNNYSRGAQRITPELLQNSVYFSNNYVINGEEFWELRNSDVILNTPESRYNITVVTPAHREFLPFIIRNKNELFYSVYGTDNYGYCLKRYEDADRFLFLDRTSYGFYRGFFKLIADGSDLKVYSLSNELIAKLTRFIDYGYKFFIPLPLVFKNYPGDYYAIDEEPAGSGFIALYYDKNSSGEIEGRMYVHLPEMPLTPDIYSNEFSFTFNRGDLNNSWDFHEPLGFLGLHFEINTQEQSYLPYLWLVLREKNSENVLIYRIIRFCPDTGNIVEAYTIRGDTAMGIPDWLSPISTEAGFIFSTNDADYKYFTFISTREKIEHFTNYMKIFAVFNAYFNRDSWNNNVEFANEISDIVNGVNLTTYEIPMKTISSSEGQLPRPEEKLPHDVDIEPQRPIIVLGGRFVNYQYCGCSAFVNYTDLPANISDPTRYHLAYCDAIFCQNVLVDSTVFVDDVLILRSNNQNVMNIVAYDPTSSDVRYFDDEIKITDNGIVDVKNNSVIYYFEGKTVSKIDISDIQVGKLFIVKFTDGTTFSFIKTQDFLLENKQHDARFGIAGSTSAKLYLKITTGSKTIKLHSNETTFDERNDRDVLTSVNIFFYPFNNTVKLNVGVQYYTNNSWYELDLGEMATSDYIAWLRVEDFSYNSLINVITTKGTIVSINGLLPPSDYVPLKKYTAFLQNRLITYEGNTIYFSDALNPLIFDKRYLYITLTEEANISRLVASKNTIYALMDNKNIYIIRGILPFFPVDEDTQLWVSKYSYTLPYELEGVYEYNGKIYGFAQNKVYVVAEDGYLAYEIHNFELPIGLNGKLYNVLNVVILDEHVVYRRADTIYFVIPSVFYVRDIEKGTTDRFLILIMFDMIRQRFTHHHIQYLSSDTLFSLYEMDSKRYRNRVIVAFFKDRCLIFEYAKRKNPNNELTLYLPLDSRVINVLSEIYMNVEGNGKVRVFSLDKDRRKIDDGIVLKSHKDTRIKVNVRGNIIGLVLSGFSKIKNLSFAVKGKLAKLIGEGTRLPEREV